MSFAASAKVAEETAGPTAGAVPKTGGAPAGKLAGAAARAGFASVLLAAPIAIWERKPLRDVAMREPSSRMRSYKPNREHAFAKEVLPGMTTTFISAVAMMKVSRT
jgi:hypothetical protein